MNRWVLAGAALAVARRARADRGGRPARPSAVVVGLEVGVAGVLLVALALWRWPELLPAGLLLVAVPWGFALTEGDRAAAAVGVGAALLLAGELCRLEPRPPQRRARAGRGRGPHGPAHGGLVGGGRGGQHDARSPRRPCRRRAASCGSWSDWAPPRPWSPSSPSAAGRPDEASAAEAAAESDPPARRQSHLRTPASRAAMVASRILSPS